MNKIEKTEKKIKMARLVIKIFILICFIFSFCWLIFVIIPNRLEPTFTIIDTKVNCTNETRTSWDWDSLEIPINKINYTATFSLGGLEETDFQTIFNYLNKEGIYAEDICWGYDSNCVYNNIMGMTHYSYFQTMDWDNNEEYKPYSSPDNLKRYYKHNPNFSINDLRYSRVYFIKITGENVRVDGQSVRNLNGDHNNILVTFEVDTFKIGIKTEEVTICQEVEVEKFSPCSNSSKPILLQRWCDKTLTISWLDETCECLEFTCINYFDKNGKRFCEGSKKEAACLKYSCGNYIISVNQKGGKE